jgi:hypothetical protein
MWVVQMWCFKGASEASESSRTALVALGAVAVAAAALVAATLGDDRETHSVAGGREPSSVRQPPFGGSWHYQLQGELQLSGARVYDIDGFDTRAALVSRLRQRGRYAICYVDAGTWENWRPDRKRFPDAVLGAGNGWPGERWLDIRRLDVLGPIMRDRFEICRRKGFDAVETDNLDAYANRTGFSLSARDQLGYNRYLARTARRLGLAVGLKNDLEQVRVLEPRFDFAVVEQCFEFDECGRLRPFTRAGKPIFEVEYNLARTKFCPQARKLHFNALRAETDLAGSGAPCP